MRTGLWLATGLVFVLLIAAVLMRLISGVIQIGLALVLFAVVVFFFRRLVGRSGRA